MAISGAPNSNNINATTPDTSQGTGLESDPLKNSIIMVAMTNGPAKSTAPRSNPANICAALNPMKVEHSQLVVDQGV